MNIYQLPADFSLCRDHVFKAVFTKNTPQSRAAITGLLSAFLGRTVTIVSIAANEPPVDDLRQRLIRYDICVKFDDGELANIEVMVDPRPLDPERMEYYLARLHAGQDIKGGGKSFKDLKRVWQLSIADQGNFFDDDELIHEFSYCDLKRRVSLGGLTSIVTVELNKLGGTVEKPVSEMSSLERWSVFIKCFADQSRRELLGEIERVEEGIAMAAQVVQGFTENELEYFREMSLHKMETAYWDEIAYAKDEGEAKGREIGREIGRAEGLETGRAEGLEVGRAEGLETGRAEGEAKSRQHILELLAQGVSAEELLRRLTEA